MPVRDVLLRSSACLPAGHGPGGDRVPSGTGGVRRAGIVLAVGMGVALSGCGSDTAKTATRTTPLSWVLGGVGAYGTSLVVYAKGALADVGDGDCDMPVHARAMSETKTSVRIVLEQTDRKYTGPCPASAEISFAPFTVRLNGPIAGRSIGGPKEAVAFPRQLLSFNGTSRRTVVVPRVVGLTTEDAQRALCSAALASSVPARPVKVVTAQSPAGGSQVTRQRAASTRNLLKPCRDLHLPKRVQLKVR